MFAYYVDLAWRSIRQTPFISALMILATTAGVGMMVAMLSVYLRVSYNPATELDVQPTVVQVQSHPARMDYYGGSLRQITYQDAMAIRNNGLGLTQAAMYKTSFVVSREGSLSPTFEQVRVTDAAFFELFGLNFIHGDRWSDEIDRDGDRVVVVVENIARNLFGRSDVIGESITLNGTPYEIVGVLADYNISPKYYDLNNNQFGDVEGVFVPFSLAAAERIDSTGNTNGWNAESINSYEDKLNSELHWIQFWVRFDNNEQREAFSTWSAGYVESQQAAGRFPNPDAEILLKDVATWLEVNGVVASESTVLLAVSFLFLTICIINTVALLLGKFLKRAPAVGTRRALGASQFHIFIQHIIEVGLIGLVGSVLGTIFAYVMLMVLGDTLGAGGIGDSHVLTELHWSMWLIAPVISVLSAVLAGLLPSWRICRMPPSQYLKVQ